MALMLAPPKPPPQDELDALIREARERQLRRRVLAAAAVAVAAAASLGIYAALFGSSARTARSASEGHAATCSLNALALSLQTQGTATQSVTFLTLRNTQRPTCSITAPAVFEITENGHPAPVVGNPLRARLHATLRQARSSSWPQSGIWWANWCGSRKGLRITVRVGSRSIASRFNVLPDCLGATQTSSLRIG
jgi:hypothetical protein